MKCKRGGVRAFKRAILLVRDPFDSIWSEYQRRITQSHVMGIPTDHMDWKRWQANAANMANTYYNMWNVHYMYMERNMQPEDILYLKYEDLKNKHTRVSALSHVAQFLGLDDVDAERLYCSFVMSENPKAKRSIKANMVSKQEAYTRPVLCRMWALFGKYAKRIGYDRFGGDTIDCPEEHNVPIPMVNVGPQGDYNDAWVKAGKPFLDFGEHPPDGPKAGVRLFGPYPGEEYIKGYNPGSISKGPNSLSGQGAGSIRRKKQGQQGQQQPSSHRLMEQQKANRLSMLNRGKTLAVELASAKAAKAAKAAGTMA